MLSNYEIIKTIGKGGFGEVFLAEEKISGRKVAIKRLLEENSDRQDLILHEIETVSKLTHPNIITYYHSFINDGLLHLVMEYCDNGSLQNQILNEKILYNTALKYCEIIASTLEYVHNKNIVHHDIKPANILFDRNNNLKICDFGVANTLSGTISYLAPEMFEWNPENRNDRRIDIYALGVTLYELIMGENIFSSLSAHEIIERHEKMDFDFQETPLWVQNIILKAIHKTPELRFQVMEDFKDAIISKNVPVVLNKDLIDAANLANIASEALKRKSWKNIIKELEYADKKVFPNNVNIKIQLGRYYLFQRKLSIAKGYFEFARRLNPRISVQKELGNIYLELGKYPFAISLLSDHINLNPADLEAHNMLVKCYYKTNRFEIAMDHLKTLIKFSDDKPCFYNNYFICKVLTNPGSIDKVSFAQHLQNPFFEYNYMIYQKTEYTNDPNLALLKSRLLFQDYRFNTIQNSKNVIEIGFNNEVINFEKSIISIGREGYGNDLSISESNSISRNHLLLINSKNDIWLYNLSDLGTYVDGELIEDKVFLTGHHEIRIADCIFTLKTDNVLLL